MAGNLYLYGENTVSEEQLTRIAKKKNMSFQELLDLNPDIKSKDLTQRELVDARFNIDDVEYNLNDMFRLAKKEDQPIEDFLVKHKDKITTTSRVGDILNLNKDKEKDEKKSYIPKMSELEDMKEGSVFWVEKNFVKNLNKYWEDNDQGRYKAVERAGMKDAFKIIDTKTHTESELIQLPSQTSLSSAVVNWEQVRGKLNGFIDAGETGKRKKSSSTIKLEKDAKEFLESPDKLNEALGGEEYVYRADEGYTDIIDYNTMLNDKRVKDKLYNYFEKNRGRYDLKTKEDVRSIGQQVIDDYLKKAATNQYILEKEKDNAYLMKH